MFSWKLNINVKFGSYWVSLAPKRQIRDLLTSDLLHCRGSGSKNALKSDHKLDVYSTPLAKSTIPDLH